MASTLVLGIDVGTQGARAVVADDRRAGHDQKLAQERGAASAAGGGYPTA